MIIEVFSDGVNNKISMPKLYLDQSFNYVVGVKQIYLEARENIKLNELIYLKSNLVDLNSVNQNQSLLTMNVKTNPIIHSHFDSLTLLPLQKYNLESASFEFYRFWDNTRIEFSKVFLQLEIEKLRYGHRF